jgi:undecaprenyl-diphosphatase
VPDWIAIVLLGVIEGITEFLPISSTGHLLIAEQWLPRQSDLFNVVIQSGAVIAVLPLFPERCRQMVFGWGEPTARRFMLQILLTFALTGLGGVILEHNHYKLPEASLPVAWALIVGGILFLLVEYWLRGKKLGNEITWTVAIMTGFGQLVAAIFPGASRSGTTILIMLALGISRPAAAEFSFLAGIPTMLAAGGLKIFKALNHVPGALSEHWSMVLLGFLVSAAVSFIAVKWLLRFVQSHTFAGFGWYRLGLGLLIFGLMGLGKMR